MRATLRTLLNLWFYFQEYFWEWFRGDTVVPNQTSLECIRGFLQLGSGSTRKVGCDFMYFRLWKVINFVVISGVVFVFLLWLIITSYTIHIKDLNKKAKAEAEYLRQQTIT